MISWLCVSASWAKITWKDPTMLLATLALFVPPFQLKIERRFWSLSSPLISTLTFASNGLASFTCFVPRACRRLSVFVVNPSLDSRIVVSSIRGSGRPRGALKSFTSFSSVSSDSQDPVGVFHGFLSLSTILRAQFRESQSLKISSFSWSPPQLHGTTHASVLRFSFNHRCDMLCKGP